MRLLSMLGLALTLSLSSVSANAASVLIFGDFQSSQNNVQNVLEDAGDTVTNVATGNLPTDISGFDTIWVMNIFTSYGAALEQQLIDFIAGGGGVYMTAERPCCDAANTSIQTIINASLLSGSVVVSSFGTDVFGPFEYNSDTVGNLDADLQEGWVPDGPGQIEGVSGDNVVVTATDSGRAVAAAWDEDDLGSGRIAVFGDINWLQDLTAGEEQVVLNTQEFLFDGFVGVNPDPIDDDPIDVRPSVIPLPAAGWLLLASLGGLVAFRRRA
ncbi:MAG: VPLPA-CTERM sorting domain-containing protein [Pseudomonadota bacterium]